MTVIAKIIAAIQKHGPMTSAQLTDKLPTIDYLSTALSQGARKGQLKRTGAFRKTMYAIGNGKPSTSAPPQDRKPPKKGKNAKRARKTNGALPRAAAPPLDFLAAITSDHRAVLIRDGAVVMA